MSELAVGPELDAEVARLMGWRQVEGLQISWWAPVGYWLRPGETDRYPVGRKEPPAYSTDLAAAWTVVDHLVSQGLGSFLLSRESDGSWEVEWTGRGSFTDPRGIIHGGATPAEAVCRAAIELAGQSRPPGAVAASPEGRCGASGVDSGRLEG